MYYSCMYHFVEILLFLKIWNYTLFCTFSCKVYFKKIIIFVKFNITCLHEFSWFTKKVICTTYIVLGISALISGAIFENTCISKLHAFLHFFIKKNILKEWITFTIHVVCTHEFSWFTKKVVCTTKVVLWFFALLQNDKNI